MSVAEVWCFDYCIYRLIFKFCYTYWIRRWRK